MSRIRNEGQCVVFRLWQKFHSYVDVTQQLVPGGPGVASDQRERYWIVTSRCQCDRAARQLASELTVITGVRVST